jgi:hypothetical protein
MAFHSLTSVELLHLLLFGMRKEEFMALPRQLCYPASTS